MSTTQLVLFQPLRDSRRTQQLQNGQVHRWYRFVQAYPDHLVQHYLRQFRVSQSDIVLDPFCGTGTTLVECSRNRIRSVGIDASPLCVFASRAKTNWTLLQSKFRVLADCLLRRIAEEEDAINRRSEGWVEREIREFPPGLRFEQSGMIKRGWISPRPLVKILHMQRAIEEEVKEVKYRDVFVLALASVLVSHFANVKFGPELYCVKPKLDVAGVEIYGSKLAEIHQDLLTVWPLSHLPPPSVIEGDARCCAELLRQNQVGKVDFVITSPPYPNEHDYTRNTRLELTLLGYVRDTCTLREIKKKMVRSHSKGIYADDCDGALVAEVPEVRRVRRELEFKIKDKTYGFAKLYPRIIEEYFGGMYRHLKSLSQVLEKGARCAYVVGDQKTYLQTYTPTAEILGQIAGLPEIKMKLAEIEPWRFRRGTTGSKTRIQEKVLILRKK
jgi:tRNA G10  N-methylase Trm11